MELPARMAMEPISIHLKEDAGISRMGEPLHMGIPLAENALANTAGLFLVRADNGERVPCQAAPTAHWPDGSIRWLTLSFHADLTAGEQATLHLRHEQPESSSPSSKASHGHRDDELRIELDHATFRFPTGELAWYASVGNDTESVHTLPLETPAGEVCTPKPTSAWQLVEDGRLFTTVECSGHWLTPHQTVLANFRVRLRLYRHRPTIEAELCIHNPRRAHHPGGLWDLGDPGSIRFRSLTLQVALPSPEQCWLRPQPQSEPWTESVNKGVYLYQDSSGGDQWHSRNHVNAEGQVTTTFRGYKAFAGGLFLDEGYRANPISGISGTGASLQASIRKFWQNFPSSLGCLAGKLVIGVFPPDTSEPYELQGGERKTHTVWIDYSTEPHALSWSQAPLVPTLDAKHYEETRAFDWFRANPPKGPLDELIRESLDGPFNFFAKRELIDEYGWRNFGDIFADHETLYQNKDEPPYISHYNNQYDAIYGFARQFALTGDRRWFELMDDLARHVSDIDIYHTSEDRSEYNNGLFWHTDHYLDAHTCTHRTFSKHHASSSTPHQTGGGPAEEHCYTTGLLYHYFLTGIEDSRCSVIELANWIITQREGDPTFLGQLLIIRQRDLSRIKEIAKGKRPAQRQYAFTRGTGNYLNTLLDAYSLTGNRDWLTRSENIINSTIHYNDDIDERHLFDVESSWSYLVFLNSVSKYLMTKLEIGEQDGNFDVIRSAFLRYAEWILLNEKPFLEARNNHEFPNDTWAAQDVRKSTILMKATPFINNGRNLYYEKAHTWITYVASALKNSNELHFSRIQIILLQNYGPQTFELKDIPKLSNQEILIPRIKNREARTKKLNNIMLIFTTISQRLLLGLRNFRITNEISWLKKRTQYR